MRKVQIDLQPIIHYFKCEDEEEKDKNYWRQMAADRLRFQKRIEETSVILNKIFANKKMYCVNKK